MVGKFAICSKVNDRMIRIKSLESLIDAEVRLRSKVFELVFVARRQMKL